MPDALTVNQHLIIAASTLPQPFHLSSLVIAGWEAAPVLLGLTTTPEYPSDNKVIAALSGGRGLIRNGWLNKVAKLTYELSDKGRQEVERLRNGAPDEPKRRQLGRASVSKAVDARLSAMFLTRAYRLWQQSMRSDVNYTDAREFWMLGEHEHGEPVCLAVESTHDLITRTIQSVAGGEVQLRDRRVVTARCLATLEDLHNWLAQRFARDLQRQREGKFRRVG